jgi:hypothetical protein
MVAGPYPAFVPQLFENKLERSSQPPRPTTEMKVF